MRYLRTDVRKFNQLRSRLPYKYAPAIAENIEGLSVVQVRLVFNGQITDVKIVSEVLAEAEKLSGKYLINNKRYYSSQRKKSIKKVTS